MREVMLKPTFEKPLAFSLLRVPFFLEPDYPEDESFEETNKTRLQRKWGGAAEFEAQKNRHRLKERGHEVGIEHFTNERIASSTMASHCLVQWVTREYGPTVAEALYADLNVHHFERGHKLNDAEFLADRAAAVGVDRGAALDVARNKVGKDRIMAAQAWLRGVGISSIPSFIIAGEYFVGGAERSGTFVDIFRSLEQVAAEDPTEDLSQFRLADALGIPAGRLAAPLALPPYFAPVAARA